MTTDNTRTDAARTMTFIGANESSRQVRMARAAVKRQVRTGALTITELLSDPPEVMLGVRLFEVIALDPRFGRQGARTMVRKLNMKAAREGVNLMSELGTATERQRTWLAGEVRRQQRVGRYPSRLPSLTPHQPA